MPHIHARALLLVFVLLSCTFLPAAAGAKEGTALSEGERLLLDLPSAESLSRYHTVLCQEPHPAGSAGDRRMIPLLAQMFEDLGLEVEVQEIWPYMPVHKGALVEVVAGDERITLELQEKGLDADPYSRDPRAMPAWNAYSGSGDVTAPVVYANYARKEDFARLEKLGVRVDGHIVIARYGRLYRGNKVDFAQAAGAVGVILYSDPEDSGYGAGIPYPEGGYYNGSSIQRGSVKTLAYPGDPLTPFVPATRDAERLPPDDLVLPRIPVQAIGWDAAAEILSRMKGEAVPRNWQGGLPFAYRTTTGSAELNVRLRVDQERRVQRTANVVGYLEGARHPEEWIVFGCHSDAWTFGAGDPHAGTIVLYEMARTLAKAAAMGYRPARTLVFANWTAEEFGIIGSTEWCEAHADHLRRHGVAYVNLDMAAMGDRFSASAAPLLQGLLEEVTRDVPQARPLTSESVYDRWAERHDGHVQFGNLGGGSDFVGFYNHLGIPATAYGAWGSGGASYHTNYETLTWYRQVVGDDYQPALMLTRIGNLLASRLANADVLPFDLGRYAPEVARHLDGFLEHAKGQAKSGMLEEALPARLEQHVAPLRAAAARYAERAARVSRALDAARQAGTLDEASLRAINREVLLLEREWLLEEGLPDRPWYRSAFAATAPESGYGAEMLPLLHHALRSAAAQGTEAPVTHAVEVYMHIFGRLEERLVKIESLINK